MDIVDRNAFTHSIKRIIIELSLKLGFQFSPRTITASTLLLPTFAALLIGGSLYQASNSTRRKRKQILPQLIGNNYQYLRFITSIRCLFGYPSILLLSHRLIIYSLPEFCLDIHSIPPEVLVHIFSYGSDADLSSLSRVCKLWNQILENNDEILWKQLFQNRWKNFKSRSITNNESIVPHNKWKQLYQTTGTLSIHSLEYTPSRLLRSIKIFSYLHLYFIRYH